MNLLNMKPEELLFTKFDGTKDHFYKVLWDELDCPKNYENRVPLLVDLMTHGEPYYQLLACIMLTSWGYIAGFQVLIEWASNPEKTPWHLDPVLRDQMTNSDSAFEKLADAVGTSYSGLESQEISTLRKIGIKALLKLFPRFFFGNTLSFTLNRNKDQILSELIEDIRVAIDKSFIMLDRREKLDFNLQMQVASLIGTIKDFDEPVTVNYAKKLVKEFPDDRRMLFELVMVLGGCKSTEALTILEGLYLKNADLRGHILQAIERFKSVKSV